MKSKLKRLESFALIGLLGSAGGVVFAGDDLLRARPPVSQISATVPKPLAPSIVNRIETSYQNEPPCMGAETFGSPDSNPKFPVLALDPQMFLANDLVGQGVRPSGPLAVSVLAGPHHGTLERSEGSTGVAVLGHKKISGEVRFESNAFYVYQSVQGFDGQDQITFLVTSNNTKFRITVLIAVGPQMAPTVRTDDCGFIAPIPPRPQSSTPSSGTEIAARVVSGN